MSRPTASAADRTRQTPALRPHDPTPTELGRRIRMLRISAGLTLKELEQRGSISATHVSEIERGKASPTVGALGRIARALGVRPALLLEPVFLGEVAITRARERHGRGVQAGGATLDPVTEPSQRTQLSVHIMTVPAAREPGLTHVHEGEEWVMVLSGTAEIRIEGEDHTLREGDSLHFRAHRTHAYSCTGPGPAVLLVASYPRLAL